MPGEDILKFFASLGVGGVLGGVIFYFYHQRVTEWLKTADARLENEQRRADSLIVVVKENTASNTAVVESVKANTAMVERLCHSQEFAEWNDNEGRRQRIRQHGDKA